MAELEIPFTPSIPFQRIETQLDNEHFVFDARWNGRAQAWFFDLFDADGNAIIRGVKIVLGINLGRASAHDFFQKNVLRAFDTTLSGREATLDDLGTRVKVFRYSHEDIFGTT